MNSDIFFENFELLADAPNGIQKLRELILQLAVMGKLVEQDPNDEPASFLSEKDTKSLKSVQENKILFDCPKSWIFTQMDQISNAIHYGYTASANNTLKDIRLLRITDIQNNQVNWETVPGCEIDEQRLYAYVLNNNDLLIARTGGTIGKSYLVENLAVKAVFASYLIRVVPNKFIFPKYLKLYADSPIYWDQLYSKCSGTGQPNVNATSLKSLIIPLPPIAEQKRIVTKVDELMALCDKLEACRRRKQELQSKLNSAALDRMLSAENQDEFEYHWQQICENFDLLYDNTENVEKLRQAILQLAVQGKLILQNPEDEPASVLIEKIKDEKKKLAKEKKIKEIKVDSIENEDLPFSLPDKWIWTMLGNLCLQVSDGPHYSPQYVSKKEGVPFLSARNIKIDGFELDSAKYVSFEDHDEFCKRIKPEKGDILYTKGGTTGIAKVNDLDFEFSIWVHVAVLRLAKSFIDPYYLALTLNSSLCYEQSQKFTHGSSNKDLGLTRMINILLPLPPLAEQKRIVEKVEQLMGLCDELEAKLRKEREDSEKLMETVIKGLLAGAVAGKPESDSCTPMQAAVVHLK